MKIAILSMQRGINYGSFLQAYGLKKTIESITDSKVEFIDILPGIPLSGKKEYSRSAKLLRNLKRVFKYNFAIPDLLRQQKTIARVISAEGYRHLGFSEQMNYNGKYDLVIIGSDEVFNCTDLENGFRPQLLGEGIDTKILVSYAASAGYTTLETIAKHNLTDRVKNDLLKFSALSVRDKNTLKIVENLTETSVPSMISLDPVFISDYTKEMDGPAMDENYILIFSYFDRIKDTAEIKCIRDFAKKKNKKVISIYGYFKWADKNVSPTPFEVLNYFKHADYVFTDTFHGTVFSIKTNRQFATFVRPSNYNKLYYILERFGLESRGMQDPSLCEKIMDESIDYEKVNKIIAEETGNTKKYLKSMIDKASLNS